MQICDVLAAVAVVVAKGIALHYCACSSRSECHRL